MKCLHLRPIALIHDSSHDILPRCWPLIENRKIASLTPLSYHFDRHDAAGLSRTLSLILARDDDVGGEER